MSQTQEEYDAARAAAWASLPIEEGLYLDAWGEPWRRNDDGTWTQLDGDHAEIEKRVPFRRAIPAPEPGHAITVNAPALIEVLEQTIAMIREGDSMTGTIEYRWSSEPGHYDIVVFQRTGNASGQGGVRMLGRFPMPEEKS